MLQGLCFHPCRQFLNSIKLGKKLQGIERSIGAAPRNSNACKICGREKKETKLIYFAKRAPQTLSIYVVFYVAGNSPTPWNKF